MSSLKNKVLSDQIKPHELRIGNIIYIPSTDQIADVSAISKIGVFVNDNIIGFLPFDKIERLKLTNNVFKSLDLKFVGVETAFIYDRFKFIWKPSYNYWYVVDAEDSSYMTKIEDVHELQNFIFEMNREEIITDRNLIKKIV